jgi:hypothetical protein
MVMLICGAGFREAEADLVSECAGIEIQAHHVHGRIVHVGKGLVAVGNETLDALVLLVRETVEHLVIVVDVPVQFGHTFRVVEG